MTAITARPPINVSRPAVPWRWSTLLNDGVDFFAVAWGLPLVVLLVGTPIALAIVLVLRLGRFALAAF